ncbi:MAG TPA: APC family permease [Conexibacter sp.]|nr:APC family permease [Conexibacter sp.]
MESAALTHPAAGEPGGLKRDAIGYLSNVVIGVASTAPAYSLAATLGFVVAVSGVGVHAPAVLLVSFIPMLFVAAAYKYLNRADPDAGTTFAWVRRALGPHLGWLNGWAIVVTDIIVMATLAQIAGRYTFLLFGWNSAANSNGAQIAAAVVWIALMTWICWRGIELSARIQQILLSAEVVILGLFAVVALAKVYGSSPAHSITPQLSWFNPFALSWGALVDGVLLGVFIYWGWDSGVTVNEESEDSNEGPGRAAVMSTILLLLIYVIVSAAAQAYGGTKLLTDNSNDVLSVLGKNVFGSPWDKLLIIAVLTSASASTQTTILPTARTALSMARKGAIPKAFASIHPRNLTPNVSTLVMGAVSIVWTVGVMALNPAQSVLGDSITALGFGICFYYGFTGIACVVYYRHEIFKSVRNFVLVGVVPLLGGLLLFGIFIKAFTHYSQHLDSSGATINYAKPILGIEVPIFIGIGALLLGVVAMLIATVPYRDFFRRKPYTEVAPPGILEQQVERAPLRFEGKAW